MRRRTLPAPRVDLMHALSRYVLSREHDSLSVVAAALPRSASMALAQVGGDHAA